MKLINKTHYLACKSLLNLKFKEMHQHFPVLLIFKPQIDPTSLQEDPKH
jgi:hypothetical protein